jgi:hypothetical protein
MNTERGSPARSPDGYRRDKTVTARHRETSDREDGQSESHHVMWWIVVEPKATLPQVKTCLPPSGALWQKALQNLLMEESK